MRLAAKAGGQVVRTSTDPRGRFHFDAVPSDSFILTVAKRDFVPAELTITIPRPDKAALQVTLQPRKALTVPVSAALMPQNGISRSGANRYSLSAANINELPQGEATPLNQVMLPMPGVALDQNQEIHIRGEHMGIQYQMNGIMLPLDINTDPTFTQLLNSRFVESVSLLDGVLPARFGYRTPGVIDIHTKSGCDSGSNAATLMGGQRDTSQGSFQVGGCKGNVEYFATEPLLNRIWASARRYPRPIRFATRLRKGKASALSRTRSIRRPQLVCCQA